jgi:digeranylgeranylglycerophospholipid reductase
MTEIVVGEGGYVLERRVFDKVLAKNAAKSGASVLTGACATGVLRDNTCIKGIKMHVAGENYEVRSKVVIGADGIASCIGKWAGIDTTLRLFDVEACAQFLISDIEVDEDYYEIYLNNRIAPGGYAWIFPKGERRANVGLGILASKASGAVHKQKISRW